MSAVRICGVVLQVYITDFEEMTGSALSREEHDRISQQIRYISQYRFNVELASQTVAKHLTGHCTMFGAFK